MVYKKIVNKIIYCVTFIIILLSMMTSCYVQNQSSDESIDITDDKIISYSDAHQFGLNEKNIYEDKAMEDIVIRVNGYGISKKEIEFQKLKKNEINDTKLKEIVSDTIKVKVIKSAADDKGIEANQGDVDKYINQLRNNMENGVNGTEWINEYLNGRNISFDEYIEESENIIRDVFQRDEYRKYVESTGGNFEEHVQNLLKIAKIEFNDSELENVYYN